MQDQIASFFEANDYPEGRFVVADPKTAEITKDIPGNVNMVVKIDDEESKKFFGEVGWVIISRKWADRSGILAMIETKQESPVLDSQGALKPLTPEQAFGPPDELPVSAPAPLPPPPPPSAPPVEVAQPSGVDDLPFTEDEAPAATIAEIAKASPNVEIVKPKPVEFKKEQTEDKKPERITVETIRDREEHLASHGLVKNPSSYAYKRKDGTILIPYSSYAILDDEKYGLILKKFGIDGVIEPVIEESQVEEVVVDQIVANDVVVADIVETVPFNERTQKRIDVLVSKGYKLRENQEDYVLLDGTYILRLIGIDSIENYTKEEWEDYFKPIEERLEEKKEVKIYTEKELIDMSTDVLSKHLTDVLKVEIPKEGRNTNKKLRTLILANQPKAPEPVVEMVAEAAKSTKPEPKPKKKEEVKKPLENVVTAPADVQTSLVTINSIVTALKDCELAMYQLEQVKSILNSESGPEKTIEELKLYLS